ncbi:hypothetical protein PMAYCL1PPCAC_26281, partial [Pristionchus mayeri]
MIVRKLASSRNDRKSTTKGYRREVALTMVGFALFISFCVSTIFHVLLAVYASTANRSAILTVRMYYIYALLALTSVNPWMLMITNRNTKKRCVF